MPHTAGTTVGRYEIRSLLGAGGMGEVYLAQDSQLNRAVALKILPEKLASDQQRMRRFMQEARAASSLNHPNIITIHEIGQADSVHFIAAEFVDGATLRHLMTGAAHITLQHVLDVAIEIASALVAAHAAGIVHRDIKPENIMVRKDGYVKVLDFGLAKLTEKTNAVEKSDPEAPTRPNVNTDPGVVMGTVQYMSPEQARGLAVDERTDIWSLGVVLYEMITRKIPFKGATASDAIASILNQEPPPLERHVKNVPAELERIVSKALAKDADERYQTVKDLLIDIRRLKQRLEVEAALERSAQPTLNEVEATPTDGEHLSKETNQDPATRTGEMSTRTVSSAEYLIAEIKSHRLTLLLVALLLTSVVAAAVYYWTRKPAVAVLPFSYTTDSAQGKDSYMEDLSDGVTRSLTNNLTAEFSHLAVKPRSAVIRYKGPDVDPQDVGKKLGARWIIVGRINKKGNVLEVQAELIDIANESQAWGGSIRSEQNDIMGGSEVSALQEDFSKKIIEQMRAKLGS